MKLQEACDILQSMIGEVIDVSEENPNNKGRYGHAVEKMLGLKLGSHHIDFEDGELKTAPFKGNKIKEDWKICKKWNKQYIEEKLYNVLLVVYDYDTGIILSATCLGNLLDHPIIRKQFDTDLDYILSQPDPDLVSQTETDVFVAKTNDKGNKKINQRACYIAGAPATYLFGLGYGKSMRKGKNFVKEMEEYEQTEKGSAA